MKQRILMCSITHDLFLFQTLQKIRGLHLPVELLPSPDGWTLTKAHLKVALRKVVSYRRIHIHFLKRKLDIDKFYNRQNFYLMKRRYCVVINYFFNAKQHHNSIKKIIYVSIVYLIHLNQTIVCNLTGDFCIRRLHHLA